MSRWARAALVCLALTVAAPAAAQPTLWERMTAEPAPKVKRKRGQPPPNLSPFEQQMWLGRYYTIKHVQSQSLSHRLLAWRTARNAFEKAVALDPKNPEAHLQLAELLLRGFRGESPLVTGTDLVRHAREGALEHWAAFERLVPRDPRITTIRLARSLEYTHRYGYSHDRKDLERALADYRGLVAETDIDQMRGDDAARILGNRAEIHMMLGELPESITWYKAAINYLPRADWAFGLAVAYDRDGQGLRARELLAAYATRAMVEGFGDQLSRRNVFFVPETEVYYYYGLIHETLGNYDLAVDAFERFVRSGAHPAFHARARDNMKKLRARIRREGASQNPRDHWSRDWHTDYQPVVR